MKKILCMAVLLLMLTASSFSAAALEKSLGYLQQNLTDLEKVVVPSKPSGQPTEVAPSKPAELEPQASDTEEKVKYDIEAAKKVINDLENKKIFSETDIIKSVIYYIPYGDVAEFKKARDKGFEGQPESVKEYLNRLNKAILDKLEQKALATIKRIKNEEIVDEDVIIRWIALYTPYPYPTKFKDARAKGFEGQPESVKEYLNRLNKAILDKLEQKALATIERIKNEEIVDEDVIIRWIALYTPYPYPTKFKDARAKGFEGQPESVKEYLNRLNKAILDKLEQKALATIKRIENEEIVDEDVIIRWIALYTPYPYPTKFKDARAKGFEGQPESVKQYLSRLNKAILDKLEQVKQAKTK